MKHNQYIDDLSKWFGFVNSSTIGKSFEGRDMKVLQILKAGPGKPNIWIDGGELWSVQGLHCIT